VDELYHIGWFHRIFCHWIKNVSKKWILLEEYETNKQGFQNGKMITSA